MDSIDGKMFDVLYAGTKMLLRDQEWLDTMCHGGNRDYQFCRWPQHILIYLRQPLFYHQMPWEGILGHLKRDLMVCESEEVINALTIDKLKGKYLDMRQELVEALKRDERKGNDLFQFKT